MSGQKHDDRCLAQKKSTPFLCTCDMSHETRAAIEAVTEAALARFTAAPPTAERGDT